MSSTRWVNITKHALEVLWREMGVLQTQLWEVTLKHNALCEELSTCQTKCARKRCYYSTIGVTRSTHKGHWSRKWMLKFRGRHWMLPSNIDWYEGIVSKRCWNVCEGDQTKFEPHAFCMYFGNILSYANGSKACKNASRILWRWEVPITQFDIWPKIFEMFLENLPKVANNANIDWAMHPKLNWEYFTTMSEKTREFLWPTPQPFMQNGELCLICCSPFGPKGAWILGTCQHMYHPQCLITLIVARRRCPQCKAPLHWHLYE